MSIHLSAGNQNNCLEKELGWLARLKRRIVYFVQSAVQSTQKLMFVCTQCWVDATILAFRKLYHT